MASGFRPTILNLQVQEVSVAGGEGTTEKISERKSGLEVKKKLLGYIPYYTIRY